MYATERSTLEHPDFALDFDNNASWNSRACPSVEALAEVKGLIAAGLDAQIVWLTISPEGKKSYSHNDEEAFEPCEAVVIRDYLRKYDLIKVI